MTAAEFRRLALAMPGASEGAHMGHADFRIGARIFATLGYPDSRWAMVKLRPEQQATAMSTAPDVFSAAKGGWGKRGATLLHLEAADEKIAANAIRMAWSNLHPACP